MSRRSKVLVGLISIAAGVFISIDVLAQGTCEPATASADLDVNNVRARVYNNGGLFWNGSGNVYTVPKDGVANSIFAASIWIGGLADGDELRFAGTQYGPWEFWPGPLGESGEPPSDCAAYDHIFSVYATDIETFRDEGVGAATDDILNWPANLGAPFVDVNEDGDYRPEDGDYPEIMGDQTLWWIMNDAGSTKTYSQTPAMGMEVQVSAFAASGQTEIENSTVYKYKLVYKGEEPLVDTYFGVWTDVDLGDATDDFVGSDSLRNLGFVYNGDDLDDDGHGEGYGEEPPALGYDLLQGPLVPAAGTDWLDPDGTTRTDSVRLGMATFLIYSSDGSPMGDPDFSTDDPYNYMRGIWRDGTSITYGLNGYGGQTPTSYMFSGEPASREYWSEENIDDAGSRRSPSDRHFLMSTGPFTMHPGDIQEVVFSIVWARGENRLASVVEMKKASNIVQESLGYEPDPALEITAPDQAPILEAPDSGADRQYVNPDFFWRFTEGAGWYDVQVAALPTFETDVLDETTYDSHYSIPEGLLSAYSSYFWRVRAANPAGKGPWSDAWEFSTSGESLRPTVDPGFEQIVEVSIGNSGPLEPRNVWHALNHEGYGDRYYLSSTGSGSIQQLQRYIHSAVPRDFELRFTEEGGYAVYAFEGDFITRVPFELWDIGISTPDDRSDDVRMIPFVLTQESGTFSEEWGEVTGTEPYFGYPSFEAVYFMKPLDEGSYESFEQTTLEAGGAGGTYPYDAQSPHCGYFTQSCFVYPIGRLLIADFDQEGSPPPAGTTIRFVTTKPNPPQVPALSSPRNGASVASDVQLWWQAEDRLHLQISKDESFRQLVIDDSSASGPPYQRLPDFDSEETYYWRARSANAIGTSDWSAVWAFAIDGQVAIGEGRPSPEKLALDAVYPNPFQTTAKIRFGLPAAESVQISVFDLLGRQVSILERGTLSAGWHETTWDATGVSSGVYFVRLEANGRMLTRQIVRVR